MSKKYFFLVPSSAQVTKTWFFCWNPIWSSPGKVSLIMSENLLKLKFEQSKYRHWSGGIHRGRLDNVMKIQISTIVQIWLLGPPKAWISTYNVLYFGDFIDFIYFTPQLYPHIANHHTLHGCHRITHPHCIISAALCSILGTIGRRPQIPS